MISHKINNKPDFNYLKTIEKKYNINLWLWAYNDRLLFRYNQLYQFSYDEILSITEQTCRFYEHVLDTAKPDYLIIKDSSIDGQGIFTTEKIKAQLS